MKIFQFTFLITLTALISSQAAYGKWSYSEDHDDMRNLTTHQARLTSVNKVKFDFPYNGGSQLYLLVGERQGEHRVMIRISRGQFWCPSNDCQISAKFDNGEIIKFHASFVGNNTFDALLIRAPYRQGAYPPEMSKEQIDQAERELQETFLKALRQSKRLVIEASFSQSGPEQFTFNTAGLKLK